jgi:hypothetical protein
MDRQVSNQLKAAIDKPDADGPEVAVELVEAMAS